MPTRIAIYRLTLYALALFFPLWFFILSDIFLWTYTPAPRLLAASVPAFLIPILLALRRTIPATIAALIFAILTWPPLIILWLQPVPDWVKYR